MNRRTPLLKTALAVMALVVLGLTQVPATAADAGTGASRSWSVDPAHTKVGFSVNHFFTPVQGAFGEPEVTLVYDRLNPANSRVSARIPVASIDTGNEKRDAHLRSADWFEADKHPYLSFDSTSVRPLGEDRLLATGRLTIKGHTREVNLPIQILGVHQVPALMQSMMMGVKEVASFRAELSIDRNDYGVGVGSWAGTAVVGDNVEIDLLVEANHS
jgi:polyisoprenoid-binding protein YceI